MDPNVTAIVVAFNSQMVVAECLKRLRLHLGPDADIIVVDNGSSDLTCATAREADPSARILELGSDRGFGTACNRGAAIADSEWLLFINPDIRLLRFDVQEFADVSSRLDIGVVSPCLWHSERRRFISGLRPFPSASAQVFFLSWGPLIPRRLGGLWDAAMHRIRVSGRRWPTGSLLAVRRRAFSSVGGFDEGYFLYYEDTDLGRRLLDRGWEAHATHAILATHVGGSSGAWPEGSRAVWGVAGWLTYTNKWYGLGAARGLRAVLLCNLGLAIVACPLLRAALPSKADWVSKTRQLRLLWNALAFYEGSAAVLDAVEYVRHAMARQLRVQR